MEFPGTIVTRHGSTNTIYEGILTADTRIRGILFKGGTTIRFHENGNIDEGILASPMAVHGLQRKAGARVRFDEDGEALIDAVLPADTVVQGIPFRARTTLWSYGNGLIEHGELAADTIVDGSKYEQVWFHKNGRVARGTLAADATIQGIRYQSGCWIQFHKNGQLASGQLAGKTTIQGVIFAWGIVFHQNGKVHLGHLAAKAIVQGVPLEEGLVGFDEAGNLMEGTAAEDITIDGDAHAQGEWFTRKPGALRPSVRRVTASATFTSLMDKALALHKEKRFEEAIAYVGEALELSPNSEDAWATKGVMLLSQHKYEQAIQCSDRALEIDPSNPWAWLTKAIAYSKLGNREEAQRCLERAKALGM